MRGGHGQGDGTDHKTAWSSTAPTTGHLPSSGKVRISQPPHCKGLPTLGPEASANEDRTQGSKRSLHRPSPTAKAGGRKLHLEAESCSLNPSDLRKADRSELLFEL